MADANGGIARDAAGNLVWQQAMSFRVTAARKRFDHTCLVALHREAPQLFTKGPPQFT